MFFFAYQCHLVKRIVKEWKDGDRGDSYLFVSARPIKEDQYYSVFNALKLFPFQLLCLQMNVQFTILFFKCAIVHPTTILFQWTPHSKYLTTTPLFPESGWGQSASLGFSNARNCKIKQKLHRTLDIFISAMQCFILYFPVYVRDVKLKLKKLDGLMSTHSRADLMAVLLTLSLDPTKCQNNVFTSEETLVSNCALYTKY